MSTRTKKSKMTRKELESKLIFTSGYLRWSTPRIAKQFGVSTNVANTAKQYAKELIKTSGGTY